MNRWIVFLSCLFVAAGARGETPLKASERYVQRRLNLNTRIGFQAGFTTLKSQTGSSSSEGTSWTRSLYGGVAIDSHFHFVSTDIDAYIGTATVESSSGTLQTGTLKQYGALGNFNFEAPIDISSFRILPKAGIGYGIMALNLENDLRTGAGGTVPVDTRQTIHGAYAILGLTLEPYPILLLTGDYAFSFYTDGNTGVSSSGVSTPIPSGSGSFSRLRVGAFARLSDTILLGAQFIQRTITVDPLGITVRALSPRQQHFLASLIVEF